MSFGVKLSKIPMVWDCNSMMLMMLEEASNSVTSQGLTYRHKLPGTIPCRNVKYLPLFQGWLSFRNKTWESVEHWKAGMLGTVHPLWSRSMSLPENCTYFEGSYNWEVSKSHRSCFVALNMSISLSLQWPLLPASLPYLLCLCFTVLPFHTTSSRIILLCYTCTDQSSTLVFILSS